MIDMSWLPVVGESGAAIIARGSNANGEWVRWEDGTQVCWSVIEKSNIDVVPSNYIWRSDNYTSPAAFSGDYVVMITQASANNESDFSIVCGIAFHNGLVSLYNTGGSNAQNYIGAIIQNGGNLHITHVKLKVFAIGRWK